MFSHPPHPKHSRLLGLGITQLIFHYPHPFSPPMSITPGPPRPAHPASPPQTPQVSSAHLLCISHTFVRPASAHKNGRNHRYPPRGARQWRAPCPPPLLSSPGRRSSPKSLLGLSSRPRTRRTFSGLFDICRCRCMCRDASYRFFTLGTLALCPGQAAHAEHRMLVNDTATQQRSNVATQQRSNAETTNPPPPLTVDLSTRVRRVWWLSPGARPPR